MARRPEITLDSGSAMRSYTSPEWAFRRMSSAMIAGHIFYRTPVLQNTGRSSRRGAARIKWPDGQMQRQWFDVDDQWFHTLEGHC